MCVTPYWKFVLSHSHWSLCLLKGEARTHEGCIRFSQVR